MQTHCCFFKNESQIPKPLSKSKDAAGLGGRQGGGGRAGGRGSAAVLLVLRVHTGLLVARAQRSQQRSPGAFLEQPHPLSLFLIVSYRVHLRAARTTEVYLLAVWGLEVQDQGVGRAGLSPEAFPAACRRPPSYCVLSLCLRPSGLSISLLIGTSVSLDKNPPE